MQLGAGKNLTKTTITKENEQQNKRRIPLWMFVMGGLMIGLIGFNIYISKAWSYLSNDPSACTNCHIMAPQYATWNHSSHRERATCNDCHVPHDNPFRTYFFKAKDGMRHAGMFSLRMEPQVIFIHEEGQKVVQENCIRCHNELLSDTRLTTITDKKVHQKTDRPCWECHREVPHGRVNSLSSVPNARVPLPESPVPDWLKEANKPIN